MSEKQPKTAKMQGFSKKSYPQFPNLLSKSTRSVTGGAKAERQFLFFFPVPKDHGNLSSLDLSQTPRDCSAGTAPQSSPAGASASPGGKGRSLPWSRVLQIIAFTYVKIVRIYFKKKNPRKTKPKRKAVQAKQTEAGAWWDSSFAELNSSWVTFPGWGICKYNCKRTKAQLTSHEIWSACKTHPVLR